MNVFSRTVGVLFVSAAVALALTGCPDEVFDDECLEDAECEDGEICYGEDGDSYEPLTCIAECDPEDEDPCADLDGDYCEPRDDGGDDGYICFSQPDECTGDEDCFGGYICEFDDEENGENDDAEAGTCVEAEEEPDYYTVRIEDFTDPENEDRTDRRNYDFNSDGLNVYNIALLEDGEVVSHARATDFEVGDVGDHEDAYAPFSDLSNALDDVFTGDDHGYELPGGIDSAEHVLNEVGAEEWEGMVDACPAYEEFTRGDGETTYESTYRPEAVLSLGVGGELYVQFEDADSEPIALTEDHTVQVWVYGESCSVAYANMRWGPDGEIGGWGRTVEDCDDEIFDESYYCPQTEVDPYFVDICADYADGAETIDTDTCDLTLPSDPSDTGLAAQGEVLNFGVSFDYSLHSDDE